MGTAVASMQCEQARNLFDAYLDGELSPSLATELGAHRVRCAECRRALALMEVSGHIIASDHEEAAAPDGFTHRLLACMDSPSVRWRNWARRGIYLGIPIAAAALVALAFLGAFDRGGKTEVAGRLEELVVDPLHLEEPLPSSVDSLQTSGNGGVMRRFQRDLEQKRQSVRYLQQTLEQSVAQPLGALEQLNTAPAEPVQPTNVPPEDVEDL